MDASNQYHALSETTDPNADLTFLDQEWQKMENRTENRTDYLQAILYLLQNSMIAPRVIHLILSWLDPLSDDEFFHTIDDLDIHTVAKVGTGTRWEDLRLCMEVKSKLYHDAYSSLQFGRAPQDYFLDAWKKLRYNQARYTLLLYFCECFIGGYNRKNQMDTLVQIEKTMSDTLFQVIQKRYTKSWMTIHGHYGEDYPTDNMSERLKGLVLQGKLSSSNLEDAVRAFLQTGIDPQSVPGANEQLVECAKIFEKIYQNKKRKI